MSVSGIWVQICFVTNCKIVKCPSREIMELGRSWMTAVLQITIFSRCFFRSWIIFDKCTVVVVVVAE